MENRPFVFIILLSFVVIVSTFGCSEKPENAELSTSDLLKCKEEASVYYKNECFDKTVLFTGTVERYSEKNGVRIKVVEKCDSNNDFLLEVDAKNLDWNFYKNNMGKCVKIFAKLEKQNFFTPDIDVIKTIWTESQVNFELRKAEIERRLEEERKIAEERRKIAEKEAEDEKKRKSLELQKNKNFAKTGETRLDVNKRREAEIYEIFNAIDKNNMNFDVGNYCLNREKRGIVSFEECLAIAASKFATK